MNRQLVIVRQFFDEARRAPASQTPFLRMRRTLDLDLCVELALGAVAVDHGKPEAQAKMAKTDLKWQEVTVLPTAPGKRDGAWPAPAVRA